MTPARRSALAAHKRRMRAAFHDRPVFCTHCRQWVPRDATMMIPIGHGRGRVECRRHHQPRPEAPLAELLPMEPGTVRNRRTAAPASEGRTNRTKELRK